MFVYVKVTPGVRRELDAEGSLGALALVVCHNRRIGWVV